MGRLRHFHSAMLRIEPVATETRRSRFPPPGESSYAPSRTEKNHLDGYTFWLDGRRYHLGVRRDKGPLKGYTVGFRYELPKPILAY